MAIMQTTAICGGTREMKSVMKALMTRENVVNCRTTPES